MMLFSRRLDARVVPPMSGHDESQRSSNRLRASIFFAFPFKTTRQTANSFELCCFVA